MMYRNLEEDRKTAMNASDEATAGDCACPCVKGVEKGQEETPAGNKTAENLAVHYDPDGK